LVALKRDETGKQAAKRARRAGMIPAILYGEAEKEICLQIDSQGLRNALKTPSGRNVILNLEVEGNGLGTLAMIKEIQQDPVDRDILHVDLQRISEEHEVTVSVSIELVGESPGVKEGGYIDQISYDVEVRVLPTKIPDKITVDISELEIGDTVLVSDLKLEAGQILNEASAPVAAVHTPIIVDIPETAVEEEEEEPELVGEEKEEEEEGAEAESEEKKEDRE
jgi:large subunit ribosomal protein L25